jgi:hypothetical protein
MKKVLMLAVLVLGLSTMVNAETLPLKKGTTKEISVTKHKKRKAKKAKKAAEKQEATKTETSKK